MLTIIFDWKTYKPKWTFYSVETILDWIKCGDLEEVKEKKEYSSINEFCVLNGVSEEHRAILNTFLAIEHTKANRILKKLRGWVDTELKLRGYEHKQILDKIDSLEQETEEDIDHDLVKENIRVMDEQDGNIELLPLYIADSWIDGDTYIPWQLQLELLTTAVNQLITNKK